MANTAPAENPSEGRKVSTRSKLAFGVGQSAEGITSSAYNLLILFFYNQVLGLSPALASLALFLALVVDAVTDPLVGSISDSYRSALGRRHPFMYVSAFPVALAFYALFSPPALGEPGMFA